MLIFRPPTASDEALLRDYVEEHHAAGITGITASMNLETMEFPAWLARVRREAETGKGWRGRSLLQLCLEGERLVGLLDIRYEIPPFLADREGHIGYGVRPSERCKGYATAMLRHALEVCREKGKTEVILGCYRDNLASASVIRRNGGVLVAEEDRFTRGRVSQYYVIRLDGEASPSSP